ncbi:MAG: hypothetical protein HY795_06440 [Desulfovibrio sp.]|nr:hypothetical protein [Desulfovibrio sp.]MBI4961263.1 hypothetical protein [Desulfovibrio sp.]
MKAVKFAIMSVFSLCIAAQLAVFAFAQEVESPPTLQASSLLPKAVLSGPDYRVDNTVTNDSYLNTYTIHSRYGDIKAESTALLYTRIAEIAAMKKMDEVAGANAFGTSLADKGKQTVQGAVNIVTDPLNTIGGALSGVGKMFARAHENLVESTPSKYEDSRIQNVIGYSQTKRDYAKEFGVDPYSTNPVLQEKLNRLSEAGYAGSITGSALQALIPGGVGIAVSSVSGTALLGSIDLTVPPAELRMQNRDALKKAGVQDALARLFINNEQFTPTQQTIIARSLSSMTGTRDRDEFVEFVAGTQDQDVALFRQRMSQMYAGYDKNVGKLARFVQLGRFVGAVRENGSLILAFPLDYLVCTRTNSDILEALNAGARSLPAKSVEFWLTGKASPATKKAVKRLGWTLHEDGAQKLLGSPY